MTAEGMDVTQVESLLGITSFNPMIEGVGANIYVGRDKAPPVHMQHGIGY